MSDTEWNTWNAECYACLVGVATGPESHTESCLFRDVPIPEQDGQFGPEWDAYDAKCRAIVDGAQ